MTPYDLDATRSQLIALFQLVDKPTSNPIANLDRVSAGRPGSKPLLPDFYSSGVIPALKALPDAGWLFFAYHPDTKNCPPEIIEQLINQAVPNLADFQVTRRQRLANLGVVAVMDARSQILRGEKLTVKLICQLSGVYLHNWQRDYREHYQRMMQAAAELDVKALTDARLKCMKIS